MLCIIIHAGKDQISPSLLEERIEPSGEVHIAGQVYKKEIKKEVKKEVEKGIPKGTQKGNKDNYQILYLKNNSIKYQGKFLEESQIILYDKENKYIQIGQKIEADGQIGFYESARNPGNSDQKLYYRKQGIHAYVWASGLRVTQKNADVLRERLYECRQRCRNIYMEHMDETGAGVLAAILLGERKDMDAELKEQYQVNGISHILAVSGLHLSFIGAGLYYIFRRITGSCAAGGIAGAAALMLYILMIGFSVSVVRALVMFLFRIGADIAGRHYDSPTALSAAAVTVLAWRPLSIYDGGFWLSFGAVAAIILIYPVFAKLCPAGLWVSVSVQLMLLPVLLYDFYECSLYSVLLNLFIIPTMSVLLLFGISGSILCMISGSVEICIFPGKWMLGICRLILKLYEKCCAAALRLPCARIVTGQPELWQVSVYYLCLAAAVLLWRCARKHRRTCRIMAGILLVSGTVLLPARFGESGSLRVTMLDVGQGDAIFMRGPEGASYFIDGGSSDIKHAGKYRIEPYLKSQGAGRLDYVFISHGDSDHTNGIREMLMRTQTGIEIGTIILPPERVWDEALKELARQAGEKGVNVRTAEPGDAITEGDLTVRCLCPGTAYNGEPGNEASMVLAVTYGRFDMLLTGDIEGRGEELLADAVKDYGKTGWEVLKVAHHGSGQSSSREILAEIKPVYALISAGKGNPYGHPHDETLKRLSDAGCTIYSTQESGAIEITVKGNTMSVGTFLKRQSVNQTGNNP